MSHYNEDYFAWQKEIGQIGGYLNKFKFEKEVNSEDILMDFGCGGGYCGACTVHINGEAMRSCRIRVGDVENAIITTIEGLDPASNHPVQTAWLEMQVPQCGYCQSGQIMQAAALLAENNDPTDDDIEISISNIIMHYTLLVYHH